MKITKLFHWLYAMVMFLPLFAIGSTCLISTFNMSSKEETEIHYKYETNEVNTVNDLILNNIYHFHIDNDTIDNYIVPEISYYLGMNFININYFDFTNYSLSLEEILNKSYDNNGFLSVSFDLYINETYINTYFTYNEVNDYNFAFVMESLDNSCFSLDGDFIYTGGSNFILDTGLITASTYNVIDYVETHNVSAEDVFYRSVDKVVQSPLFNWAYDSFLVTPFSYIANIFSLQINSPIVLLLSYWLAISLIWLVFDVVMYVPLLVHSWIDRGVIK